jgi:hypothetical protein
VRRRIDRGLVALVVALALLVAGYAVSVWLVERSALSMGAPGSTYDGTVAGLSVYFRYLEELGLEPERLERFDELPEDGTLIVAEPLVKAPSGEDAEKVAAWVEAGGRLVLLGRGASDLADDLDVSGSTRGGGEEALEPLMPSVYARGIETIDLDGERLQVSDPAWVTHYKDLSGQGALSRAFGEGEVVWVATTYPVSNAGIGEGDNAQLGVVLAAMGDGPILFDEYHHGFISGGGLWEQLGHGGRAALLLALLAAGALLLGPLARLGQPIEEPAAPGARTGRYTGSLAELYRRAGARAEALETLEGGLERVLARRYGSLAAGLERHPQAADALARSQDARRTGQVDADGFVEAASGLGAARREVEGRHG